MARPKKIPIHEEKDSNIQKLKTRIRRLERENEQLYQQIKTLEQYKKITNKYIDNQLDGVPVENVIEGIKNKEKLKTISTKTDLSKSRLCPKCGHDSVLSLTRHDNKIQKLCTKCDYRELIDG